MPPLTPPSVTPPSVTELAPSLCGGRTLVLESDGTTDHLRILAPDGLAEVDITLTADGPVVRVRAARLEVASAAETAIRCQRLTIDSHDGIDMHTAGSVQIASEELRVRTERSIHLNGETVRLNCSEDGTTPPLPQPSGDSSCGCPHSG